MISDTNQSKSNVSGDQVGGDKVSNYNVLQVKKELAVARNIIAETDIALETFIDIKVDDDNTILIQKLKKGGFNFLARKNAKLQKLRTISVIITLTKKEKGKGILGDIYANLISVINTRYIVHMQEGETLKTSFNDILNDLSNVVTKYSDIVHIDKAFLEGLLYVATSNCALNWVIEENEDED